MKIRLAFLACAIAVGCAGVGTGLTGAGVSGAGASSSSPSAGSASGSGGSSSATGVNSATSAGVGGAAGSTGGGGDGGAGGAASGAGGDPYDTPLVCTSMITWTGGDGAAMQPGFPCEACHAPQGPAEDHTFDVSGTVYPTAHEPDNCDGAGVTGVTVVVTDADGTDHPLAVDAAGNFYHDDAMGQLAFAGPLMARVAYDGQVRRMITPLTSGDCNGCHTPAGTSGAPGRVMLP